MPPRPDEDEVYPASEACTDDEPPFTARSEGASEKGPGDALPPDPPGAGRSFHHLLTELAAEHQRALARLRADLEAGFAEQDSTEKQAALDATAGPEKVEEPAAGRQACVRVSAVSEAPSAGSTHLLDLRHSLSRAPSRLRLQGGSCGPQLEVAASASQEEREVAAEASQQDHDVTALASGYEQAAPSRQSPSSVRLSPFDLAFGDSQSDGVAGNVTEQSSDRPSSNKSFRSAAVRSLNVCGRVARTQAFDSFSGLVIVLNAVTLGIAANNTVISAAQGEPPDTVPVPFQVINMIFTVWFTFELLLRFFAFGPRGFCSKEDWSWNLFDCLVVGSDLVYTILDLTNFDPQGSARVQNLTVVRIMRVLRITRAIRVVRLIRFFRELRMMVFSVLRSVSTLLWSLLLLSVTVYIFSLYFVQVVAFYVLATDAPPAEGTQAQSRRMLAEWFGSLVRAMYTLYQAVSGGISWGEIGDALSEVDPMHTCVLCFFSFFTTFALLNIITGIFVDTAINSAQNDKDEIVLEQMHKTAMAVKEMNRIFHSADRNGSGTITLRELEKHLRNDEVRAHLSSIGIEIDRARGLFRLLDMDMSGQITVEEFVFGCQRLKGNAKSIDLATLMLENQRSAEQQRRHFDRCGRHQEATSASLQRLEQDLAKLLGDEAPAP